MSPLPALHQHYFLTLSSFLFILSLGYDFPPLNRCTQLDDSKIDLGFSAGFLRNFGLNQRSRIRKRYNIRGSVKKDICCLCWCTPCTLMQNDREIRAREGAAELMHL